MNESQTLRKKGWFSAKVRYAVLIGGEFTRYSDSLRIFRAQDFGDAFQGALRLGYAHEEKHRNLDGEDVVLKFAQIVSLDGLGADLEDGQEVYSEAVFPKAEDVPGRCAIRPEDSSPTQTI